MDCNKCNTEMKKIKYPQLEKHVGKHVCLACENIQ